MKKKIISVFLFCFIFVSSTVSSFANPLVGYLSYEALMGLLSLAAASGIVISNQQQYDDFIDDLLSKDIELPSDYLNNLEELVWNEYINRNNGNNGDNGDNGTKEPLKVPYVPDLFNTITAHLSNSNKNYDYYYKNVPFVEVGSLNASGCYDIGRKVILSKNSVSTVTIGDFTIKLKVGEIYGRPSFSYDVGNGWISSLDSYSYYPTVSIFQYGTNIFFYYRTLKEDGTYFYNTLYLHPSSIGTSLNKHNSSNYNSKDFVFDDDKSNVYISSNDIQDLKDLNLDLSSGGKIDISEPKPLPDTDTGTGGDTDTGTGGDTDTDTGTGGDTDTDTGTGGDTDTDLKDTLVSLLVPSDDFWTTNFNDLLLKFEDSFPMVDVDNFKNLIVEGKPFPNIFVTVFGASCKIVDGDVINSIADWLRPLIAGFMMLCLMLFNYRKIYKLIRNTEPFGSIATGTSEFRTGMSAPAMDSGGFSAYDMARDSLRDVAFDMRNEILSRKNGDTHSWKDYK